jgi:hypothetical protein
VIVGGTAPSTAHLLSTAGGGPRERSCGLAPFSLLKVKLKVCPLCHRGLSVGHDSN